MLKRNIRYFIEENNFNVLVSDKESSSKEDLREYVNNHLSLIVSNDLYNVNMTFSRMTKVHFVILDLYNKISVEEKEILRKKLGFYNSKKSK